MEQNTITLVQTLVRALTPMAAHMKERLHCIDELLSELGNLDPQGKGPVPEVEVCRFDRGELSREIQAVAERLKTVSAPTVVEELRSLGVVVSQNRPASCVGNALRRLVRAGVLKEVNRGSGRRPAIYQFLGRNQ